MLTTESHAPYNRSDMSVDDPALDAAIRRHEERLARDPASLAFAQLADLYRKAGRTREAVALCRNGLARYPHYTTARLILAKTLAAEGALDAAQAEIGAILELNQHDLQCHRLAAEIQRRLGHIDRAVTATTPAAGEASGLQRVLADDTFATIAFGTLCLEQGCVEEAAQAFTRILRKDPDNHAARERLETTLHARARRKG